MSLAFLVPDASPTRELHARSPMERLALAAGARLARVQGWNVPNAYDEPLVERARITQTVGFADRSALVKLELQGEPRTLAQIVARASDGLALDPGVAGRAASGGLAGTWWCPVTPSRVLVLGAPTAAAAVRESVAGAVAHATRMHESAAGIVADAAAVREAAAVRDAAAAREAAASADAQGTVTVVDVTCALAALSLIGPGARELLARFCAIDVRPAIAPPAAFRPGSVARTPGYVLVEAHDRLLVLVGWALGEYLWRVVADAAAHLGGGPVGAEALIHHLESADA
ncbi:MAG TPA: hypothetical protein VMD79_14995 [Solirubrobacteraceae bacterium]|nr:hypothetical protein [Solirubrobacteraceae bacterium]